MLTKNDIELLKEIFVTKEEFHTDLKELKNDLRNEIRQNTESVVNEIHGMVNMLGEYIHRTENNEQKLKNISIILNDHEARLKLSHNT